MLYPRCVTACALWLQVAKVVAPKKAKLAEAEAQYQEVMVGLKAKQQELQVRKQYMIAAAHLFGMAFSHGTCLHTDRATGGCSQNRPDLSTLHMVATLLHRSNLNGAPKSMKAKAYYSCT
jgi:hypothetical protein